MKSLAESAKRSDFVPVDVSEARSAKIWSRIAPRLNRPRRWPWFASAGIAACAAALIVASVRPLGTAGDRPATNVPAALVASEHERQVRLNDGSELELRPQSEVVVAKEEPHALELDLKSGVVRCQVAHVPGRRFVVRAGDVKVIAVGTRFRVSRQDHGASGVAVDVEQGVVEVHAASKVERLLAGQHWENTGRVTQAEPAHAAETAEPPPSPLARHTPSERPTTLVPSGSAAPFEASEPADARKLFESANRARRAGDLRAAASGYEALLRNYPADGRATVAALELGRLRMDHLGDHAGAISALNRAASSGGGAVREDAMARLVRAYAATGSRERCLRARENYERSYPEGHHRAEVRAACGPR